MAAAVGRLDAACTAACVVAMECQPILESEVECLRLLQCADMDWKVDVPRADFATILGCLDAATRTMDCVGGLGECTDADGANSGCVGATSECSVWLSVRGDREEPALLTGIAPWQAGDGDVAHEDTPAGTLLSGHCRGD